MALIFVFDEHLRGFRHGVVRHNRRAGRLLVDAICVGDVVDLPLGTLDPDLLAWAEREGRIIVTLDQTTMPGHLRDHLRQGHHSPGVLIIDDQTSWRAIIDYLELVAHAGKPDDFQDAVTFGP